MTNDSKKIGLLSCIMILIGGMVGSAIFSLSGVTYAAAGPAVIITWILGGIILLLYGLETAELCTIYPKSGGIFIFPYEALGKTENTKVFWGWMASWSYLNVCIFGAGFSAIYIAQYLGVAWPFFSNIVLWAVIAVVLVTVLCLFNISVAGVANIILVAGIIILCLIYAFSGFGAFNGANFAPFFTQGAAGGAGFVGQIPVSMLAFGAIVAVAYMVTQVKDPRKTVPKSMIISMIITIALYVIILVATVGMVAASFYIENPGMQYIPLFAAAWTVLYNLPWLPGVISIAATLALLSTMLVLVMNGAWTLQAAAEYKLLPKFLGKVNPKTGTPVAAVLVVGIITLIFALFPDLTSVMTNTGAIANALCVVIISIALLKARKGHEYQPGDFRLKGGAFLPILTIILILVFICPVVFQPLSYWYWMIGWVAVGIILMFIFRAVNKNK